MKHNEVAPAAAGGKTGIGLSVAVLDKVIHAPRLLYPNQLEEDVKEEEERKRQERISLDSPSKKKVDGMYAALSEATKTSKKKVI